MEPPKLEYAFEIKVQLSKRFRYGPCTDGMERGHVHVLGGQITGPRFNGRVVPGTGGDWPVIRPDGTCVFEARYLLEGEDGTLIQIRNTGIRHGPPDVLARLQNYEPVDPSEYYMAITPQFDAPEGPYAWLTRTVFVGRANRRADDSVFTYWAVMP